MPKLTEYRLSDPYPGATASVREGRAAYTSPAPPPPSV